MGKLHVWAVTTSRADYGLLYPLLQKLHTDDTFLLEVVVTGSHLSPLHGNTVEIIERDGFTIAGKVEMTMQSDSEHAICQAVSLGLIGFSHLFRERARESLIGSHDKVAGKAPDLVILLGDRYELWAASIAATMHHVPIVHIHGGEVTYGAIDDQVRHAVTKMAALHFPSIELYAGRIVQMGEHPERVHAVGALGIDNIQSIEHMSVSELSQYAGVDFTRDVALMTFHPVTQDEAADAAAQVEEVLLALVETELFTLITMPNADAGGHGVYETILRFIGQYPERFKLVKNLGQRAYLSAMQYAKLMIGNSSSGIIESASFRLPVVNIGDRQAGRYKPANVIDCLCTREAILTAVKTALSQEFAAQIADLENPYGDGQTAQRILTILKQVDFTDKSTLLKKGFYDLP